MVDNIFEHRDFVNNLIGYIINYSNGSSKSGIREITEEIQDWVDLGNTIQPDPNVLAAAKSAKIEEAKAEAVSRIAAQVPEWDTWETVRFVVSIANMLDLGSMNAAQTLAKDIYLYGKNTVVPDINSKVDVASVLAIDVGAYAWPS